MRLRSKRYKHLDNDNKAYVATERLLCAENDSVIIVCTFSVRAD